MTAGGCSEPWGPRVVTNADPSVKVPAIEEAVQRRDLSVAPQLVKDLDNDDPAVRFYAIQGLRRLTGSSVGSGDDLGYKFYYDDPDQRRPGVDAWRQWLIAHGMQMPTGR